eukprot:3709243-Prymnesium_polylepis.3
MGGTPTRGSNCTTEKAMLRPRKATGLQMSLVRPPSSLAVSGPDGAENIEFLERSIKSSMTGGSTVEREQNHA